MLGAGTYKGYCRGGRGGGWWRRSGRSGSLFGLLEIVIKVVKVGGFGALFEIVKVVPEFIPAVVRLLRSRDGAFGTNHVGT